MPRGVAERLTSWLTWYRRIDRVPSSHVDTHANDAPLVISLYNSAAILLCHQIDCVASLTGAAGCVALHLREARMFDVCHEKGCFRRHSLEP